MSYNEVKTINGRAVRDDTARDLIEDVEDTLREEIANIPQGGMTKTQLWQGRLSVNVGNTGTLTSFALDPNYDEYLVNVSYSSGYFTGYLKGVFHNNIGVVATATWLGGSSGNLYEALVQITNNKVTPAATYRSLTSTSITVGSGSFVINEIVGVKY